MVVLVDEDVDPKDFQAVLREAAEHFDFAELRFEVVDMDHNRVDKVLIARMIPGEQGSSTGACPASPAGNDQAA